MIGPHPIPDDFESPAVCPTCGQDYDAVIMNAGRYSLKPRDGKRSVNLHVVGSEHRGSMVTIIYVHEGRK